MKKSFNGSSVGLCSELFTKSSRLSSMLLAAQNEKIGMGMSDRSWLNKIITLINAEHETTTTSLTWPRYLLGTHPDFTATMQEG